MDWSRFDRERFRKIMAVALRAEGAEALTALERARAHLDGAGGSIDDVLGGTVSVQMHGAREGAAQDRPPHTGTPGPNGRAPTGSQAPHPGGVNGNPSVGVNGRQASQGHSRPPGTDDPLRHALYASHIVTQLRTENRRLNDLLDQATRYIAELEAEVSRAQAPRPEGQDGGHDG